MAEAEGVLSRQQRRLGDDQFPVHELEQTRPPELRLFRRERLDGPAVKDLAFHGGPLEHGSLRAPELVEAGGEHGLERRWHDELTVCLMRHRHELRDEQRITAGGVTNPRAQIVRHGLGDQRGNLVLRERLQAKRRRPARTAFG